MPFFTSNLFTATDAIEITSADTTAFVDSTGNYVSSSNAALRITTEASPYSADVIVGGALYGENAGITMASNGANVTVLEGGSVTSANFGIAKFFSTPEILTVTNYGTVTGADDEAVSSGSGEDAIYNFGKMSTSSTTEPAISTFAGDDNIVNSGTIVGDIEMGDGNDRYDAVGAGVTSGIVFGGDDDDILFGADATDIFNGGSGMDILRGRDGNDFLNGDSGLDQIFGGNDDDTIRGGSGDDRLFGDNGNDILEGGSDNDILRGGNGNDIMNGGTGRDVHISGSGQDVFLFTSTADSMVGATRDAIRDFERGEDVIDLEMIAGGGLSYRGTAAFTGSGPEVRHVTTAAGSTIVRIDVDGDAVRDMEILVQFTPSLGESDFAL